MIIPWPRFALALSLFVSTAVQAQSGVCAPELLASDRRGSPTSISRQDDVLYLGAGAAVVVIDTTVLSAPVERGRVDLDEMVREVAHWQSTVVALGASALTFVDAGDPDQPTVAGTFPFPAGWTVRGVAARASHAFLAETNGLRIVSFVDPTAPTEVGFLPATSTRDVEMNGPYAYLLGTAILRVIDVSNPASPAQVATLPVQTGNDDHLSIAGSGNRLAAWGTWQDGHFFGSAAELFSLADPQLPVRRSSIYADDFGFQALAFAFDRLYFGYAAYDVSSLANPVEIGWLDELGWPVDLAIAPDPDRLFVATTDGGLHVAEVSDPADPTIEASIFMPSGATDGYLAGTMAVLVRERELEVLDLSDPTNPERLGGLPAAEGGFEEVERVRDHAYVTAGDHQGLKIVDLSNPAVPVLAGSVGGYTWNAPAFAGGLVGFVDDCAAIVRLLDAEDPGAPLPLGAVPLDDSCYKTDFAMTGSRLYVWDYDGFDGDSRLRTFDISDPAQPLELAAAVVDPWHWSRSALRGRYLLLTDEDRFDVLDLAAPANPVRVVSLPLPVGNWFERKLTLYGGIALVAPHTSSADDRVFLVDATNPRTATVIDEIDTPGSGNAAFAGPGLILVADGSAGYSIYSSCVPFADGFESGDLSEWVLVMN